MSRQFTIPVMISNLLANRRNKKSIIKNLIALYTPKILVCAFGSQYYNANTVQFK